MEEAKTFVSCAQTLKFASPASKSEKERDGEKGEKEKPGEEKEVDKGAIVHDDVLANIEWASEEQVVGVGRDGYVISSGDKSLINSIEENGTDREALEKHGDNEEASKEGVDGENLKEIGEERREDVIVTDAMEGGGVEHHVIPYILNWLHLGFGAKVQEGREEGDTC